MYDRDAMRASYRTTIMTCAASSSVVPMLVFVAWVLAASPEANDTGAAVISPLLLAIFGLVACAPIVLVPIVRRVHERLATTPAGATNPVGGLMTWSIIEHVLWEIPVILGFVAFVLGAPWTVLLGSAVFSLAGFAYSFPRWSRWEAFAQRVEATHGMSTIISD